MDMTPHLPIYMDYGATTPVDPRVVDAMIPWLREHFGNPASRSHAWGWEAEEAVEKAREQVAALIGADPREIVWTSGATQSNNPAIDLAKLPVDLMSLASHKTYGPKGIGALYVRRKPRVRIEAQMHGGGHERGMRSGTLPTHQIVGMGEAFRIAREEMGTESERIRMLQQRLIAGLSDIEQVFLNGHPEKRVPH